MLTFSYTARDEKGNTVNAEVKADSEQSAIKLINNQGFTPIKIEVKGESNGSIFKRKRIRAKDKILFTRQLATLVSAGLPITQSMRTVAEQTTNPEMGKIIALVIGDIEAGKALADAFSAHPKVFNDVFVNLVAAGEASGTLDQALERLATQQEKDAEVSSKVKGAMVYPLIVLAVITLVIIFMLTTVLPQVEDLYADLNQELPLITQIMLTVSDLIISFWWLMGMIGAVAVYFLRRYIETESGRKSADKIKMKIPLFGKLFMKLYMARFTRTGQTLMASGVPMLEMMRIAGNSVNNVIVNAAIQRSTVKVKGGKALSYALEQEPEAILPLVPQMINIGEQSGSIDTMMGKAASFYEEELDNEIKTISTTIEPLLMLVLAVVAAAMVGAILIPVYGLVGTNLAV